LYVTSYRTPYRDSVEGTRDRLSKVPYGLVRCAVSILPSHERDSHIAKELEITPVLDKLLEYKRNWI
jgi:hypothetical protein